MPKTSAMPAFDAIGISAECYGTERVSLFDLSHGRLQTQRRALTAKPRAYEANSLVGTGEYESYVPLKLKASTMYSHSYLPLKV